MNQAAHMNTGYRFTRTHRRLAALVWTLAWALAALTHGSLAFAENGRAVATAAVLATPVVVSKTADLSFGKFAASGAGSITISTSGARTVSGGVLAAADGPAMTAASFVVSGAAGAGYSITHGGTSTLSRTGGPDTMPMTKFTAVGADNRPTGAPGGILNGGAQTIYVGATLDVGANQAAGAYTGTVSVTVEYN
jgi:spore coat protein U-like protein